MPDLRISDRAIGAPRSGAGVLVLASSAVGIISFIMYRATMLPGVELGDSGGFQAAVSWPGVSARQAYPLYFALGRLFVRITGGHDPAFALNLMSALFGAVSTALLTWIAARVTGMVTAGIAAGAWLATSYTFWTQAVIAEVYTLHLTLIGICLAALLRWRDGPGLQRLALFFAVYALGFGNHLSMILLLPGFAAYLLASAPRGPREILRTPVVALAVAMAAAGALQYIPNLTAVFNDPLPPRSWFDGLSTFWFEVTKADWRDTMVMGVQRSEFANRAGMWWFDLRQQVGIAGTAAACIGAVSLWRYRQREAMLILVSWLVNTVFAFTYNVGDTHVFYMPSHYFAALWIGCALLPLRGTGGRWGPPLGASRLAAVALVALAGWRGYDTWPAVDRHEDDRALRAAERLGTALTDDRAVLGVELNWQTENALLYYARWVRPDLVWFRAQEAMPQLPWLVRDNAEANRSVVLTQAAAEQARRAFGDALTFTEDVTSRPKPLAEIAAGLPRGAVYVVALLHPYPDQPLDRAEFTETIEVLGAGRLRASGDTQYIVLAGRAGEVPVVRRHDNHPFRERVSIDGLTLDLRMESWLPTDTFRRAGFGHVIVGHRHAATLDRGVTLVSLGKDGEVDRVEYRAGLYAPQPRWRIERSAAGGRVTRAGTSLDLPTLQ